MIRMPVYFDLNGIHQIAIFEEMDDGNFRRTTEQPMRLLRDNIIGIGPSVGQLVSAKTDREERCWQSPTIIVRNRATSYYQFLREQYKSRKIFVFSRPSLNSRVSRFDCHELQLKAGISLQVQSLLSRKLIEAIELNLDHVASIDQQNANSVA